MSTEEQLTEDEKGDIIMETARRALERARLARLNEPTQEELKERIEVRKKKFTELKDEVEKYAPIFDFDLDYDDVLFQGACRNGLQEKIQWVHHWKKLNERLGTNLEYKGYCYPLPDKPLPVLDFERYEKRRSSCILKCRMLDIKNESPSTSKLLSNEFKDVLVNVLVMYLDLNSVFNFSLCSRRSYRIIHESEECWTNLCHRDFDLSNVKFDQSSGDQILKWKTLYRKTLFLTKLPFRVLSSYYSDQHFVVQDEMYRITEKKSNGAGGILLVTFAFSENPRHIFLNPFKKEEEDEKKEKKKEEKEEEEEELMSFDNPKAPFEMRTSISGHTRTLVAGIYGKFEVISHQIIPSKEEEEEEGLKQKNLKTITTIKLTTEEMISFEKSMFENSGVDEVKYKKEYILELFSVNNEPKEGEKVEFVGLMRGFGFGDLFVFGAENRKYDLEIVHKLYLKGDPYIM